MAFISPETLEFIYWLANESIYRYPVALIYMAVLYVAVTVVWNKTQQFLATIPEQSYPTPSPSRLDGYDSLDSQEQTELDAVLSQFREDRVVTPREIQAAVYESTNGVEIDHSQDEWWDNHIKPWLRSHPDIEQLDSTERRWRFEPQ